ETFLDHLQRNPRLRPYDFWPLVADSTVIVQHVCSVVIFFCCFIGIYKKNVSPVSVVGWGSVCTILGWVLWDFWVRKEQEEATRLVLESAAAVGSGADDGSSFSSATSSVNTSSQGSNKENSHVQGLGLTWSMANAPGLPRRKNSGLS